MTNTKAITTAIAVFIFISVVVLILVYKSNLSYSEIIATAGLLFAVAAFGAVLLTLNATYIQLNKVMAKPDIKVAFNNKGEQQTTLTYKDGKINEINTLWLTNVGNAITRYFQVDIIIPEKILILGKIGGSKVEGGYAHPIRSDGRIVLYVNNPYPVPVELSSALDINKCIEKNENLLEIKYVVYGDWAETQEGKLKIILKKQEAN